ncbi:MAG: dihydroorotate dehydrogenase-like protein [Elusimicrobia bacterium]|nr:dihydroorotate dehydrogenase-like protein [Elusimicrobiota bacterium]
MDLSTTYMGMRLKNPLVVSASPLSQNLATVQNLEEAGASAVVLHSLFEEQIARESRELYHHLTFGTESYAEALTYFPEPKDFVAGPDEYLEHVRKVKKATSLPVIGSLNGHSKGGWTEYAKLIQEAGADALELNIYIIPTDPAVSGAAVEETYLDILRSVKASVRIPVAVKLSPFFSSMTHMAKRLDAEGADALVLFNRFYQPDIDLDNLEVIPSVLLSTPMAMRLPLRWIAILCGRIRADLAATSGVHQATDVLKMLMAGANVTMLCSTLYKNGIGHVRTILQDMTQWMTEHEYESVTQMKGSMSQKACENPEAFERANYVKAMKSEAWLSGALPR